MQYTEKLQLRKPQRDITPPDPSDINDLNYNFDKLDSAIGVNDVKPREEFPLPSADKEDQSIVDEYGRTWVCQKVKEGSTTYGYEDITYTEGLDADKPAEGYYHATDSDVWYKDGEVIDVNVETELPTPSAETVGNYYLVGTDLSLGTQTIVEDLYAWIRINVQYYISDTDKPKAEMIDGVVYTRLEEEVQ